MRAPADKETTDVLRVLRERLRAGSTPGNRTDGLRVALSIEGGGMRGAVSAGMALALHELGLVPAFDAVYGASAGAITGAWLLSSRPEGLRGWAEPDYAKELIRWRALLRRRPVVDIRALIEVVYQTRWPMDFESVLASTVEYHPLATDAVTGASTDLRPLIGDPAELRLALRASASLPFLAGASVQLVRADDLGNLLPGLLGSVSPPLIDVVVQVFCQITDDGNLRERPSSDDLAGRLWLGHSVRS